MVHLLLGWGSRFGSWTTVRRKAVRDNTFAGTDRAGLEAWGGAAGFVKARPARRTFNVV
jgi:hypothetical protein